MVRGLRRQKGDTATKGVKGQVAELEGRVRNQPPWGGDGRGKKESGRRGETREDWATKTKQGHRRDLGWDA